MISLIKANPNQRISLVLYPELHSCWKRCHWDVNENGESYLGLEWKYHNKLKNCHCFANPKRKHYKCQRKWHLHGWQIKGLDLSLVKKEVGLNSFLEQVDDHVKKLSYNMKDWPNFHKYPAEYRSAGLNFKRKWYWLLDSEKFLLEKEKKKKRNSQDYQKRTTSNKESQTSSNNDKKRLARKSSLQTKYNLQNKLKKLAWDNSLQRKILNEKLKEIKQKLEISKPIFKIKKQSKKIIKK